MNKKIFAIPFLILTLTACGGGGSSDSGPGTDTGGGNDGGSGERPVERPKINDPVNLEEGYYQTEAETNVDLRFTLNSASKDAFRIGSSNTQRDVKTVDIRIESSESTISDEDLVEYIKNYDGFIQQLEELGDDIINYPNQTHKVSFQFEDLPAHLYQERGKMNEERIISNAITFKVIVNEGMNLESSKFIKFDHLNENTMVTAVEDANLDFEFAESSNGVLTLDLVDPNPNDEIVYSYTMGEQAESFLQVSSDQCDEEGVCTVGDSKTVILNIATSNIEVAEENAVLNVIVKDGSATGSEFKNENEEVYNFNVKVVNNEGDLTPSVSFDQASYDISESGGGTIPFTLSNAPENPDLPLDFNIDIDLEGMIANVELDREKSEINFSGINVSGNTTKVLTGTVSDGVNEYSTSVTVNFIEDVNRAPQLSIDGGNNIVINESDESPKITYSAILNNPERNLNVSVDFDLGGSGISYSHNSEDSEITFSTLELTEDYTAELTITATDGVDTVEDTAMVVFNSDIEPVIDIPSIINVSEETGEVVSYNGYVSGSSSREFTMNYNFVPTLPSDLTVTNDDFNQTFTFNTDSLSIREDQTYTMEIEISDGISTVDRVVTVNLINDVDKELSAFEERYDMWKGYHDQVVSLNAEETIFGFYKEVALIDGINPVLLDEMGERISTYSAEEQAEMTTLINEIEDFIANTPPGSDPSVFDSAEETLNSFVVLVENYGIQSVSELNSLAQQVSVNIPSLSAQKNTNSSNDVFGRYVGNGSYGSYLDPENTNWRFSDEYKMLDLVNPNKICN